MVRRCSLTVEESATPRRVLIVATRPSQSCEAVRRIVPQQLRYDDRRLGQVDRSTIEAIGKFPDGCEIALLCLFSQFLRNPSKPKWIAPESNPKRIIEGLFPVHTSNWPAHNIPTDDCSMRRTLILFRSFWWNHISPADDVAPITFGERDYSNNCSNLHCSTNSYSSNRGSIRSSCPSNVDEEGRAANRREKRVHACALSRVSHSFPPDRPQPRDVCRPRKRQEGGPASPVPALAILGGIQQGWINSRRFWKLVNASSEVAGCITLTGYSEELNTCAKSKPLN